MASLDDCCGFESSVLRISVFETGNWGGGGDPWSLLTTKDRRGFLWCAGGLYRFTLLFLVVFENPAIDLLLNESGTHFWYKAFWFLFFLFLLPSFLLGCSRCPQMGGLLFTPSADYVGGWVGGKIAVLWKKIAQVFCFWEMGFITHNSYVRIQCRCSGLGFLFKEN